MNEPGKSDSRVVPKKAPNKAEKSAAEGLEGRRLAKRNTPQAITLRTQGRTRAQAGLGRVRQAAEQKKGERFTALLHHSYAIDTLRAAYYGLARDAAPGVDGETWEDYGQGLEANLAELSKRVGQGTYRPQPVRRVYIPKRGEGKQQRPIGVTTLEDKIVQRATVLVLNEVYEPEFAGLSYGARPGRSAHQALTALDQAIHKKRVKWVLDADLRDFFGSLEHEWLMRFVEHRIGDKRVVRLISEWLAAGVLEDGTWTRSEAGTPQGGSISPMAANLYLHYVFDVWAERWRRTAARGDIGHRAVSGRLHRGVREPQGSRAVSERPTGAARAIWAKAAPGQDATAGIWAVRPRRTDRSAGRESRNLPISGPCPQQWTDQERGVHGGSAHRGRATASQAQRGES